MPMRDIYKPAVPYKVMQQEVDATPTADQQEGMQVPTPFVPDDKAFIDQYSHQFDVERVAILAGAFFQKRINVIPRSWAVYVNANSGAGATARVQSGAMDVTLTLNNGVLFPGRTPEILVTAAVATADVTIIALGDDKLRF
jgi:hypothetical protein